MLTKRLLAAFITITSLGAPSHADDLPTVDSSKQKGITQSSSFEGESQTWALGTSERKERIYPSNFGTAGIFRVRSAESLPDGALTFGIGGEFYYATNAPDTGVGNREAKTLAESIFIGYSPIENLTVAVMRRSSSTTLGSPQVLVSSLGDLYFSTMYSVPISPSLALAPIAQVLVASNFNRLAANGNTVSFGLGGAATYSLYPSLGTPLVFHANAIYHIPQIREAAPATVEPETYFKFSRFHTITLALGAEYRVSDAVIPFAELHQTIHANSGLGFGESPSTLSLGSRFMPFENKGLAFLLGFDVGLGQGIRIGVPYTPPWQAIGQLSYTFGVTQTERKHYYTTKDVNVVDRKFVIKKNVNFKVGSAELLPESTALLDQIAEVIRENNVRRLLIVGHTDSSHNDDYNLKLSIDRANSVKRYLVGRGIPEESLTTQGHGKRKPKAPNSNEAGRTLNRRVEFLILE